MGNRVRPPVNLEQTQKDCALLQEFGVQPHLWVEYMRANEVVYTDGYTQSKTIEKKKGYPLLIQTTSVKEGELLGRFTLDNLYVIQDINKAWSNKMKPAGKHIINIVKNINSSLALTNDHICSKYGFLYKPSPLLEQIPENPSPVFHPDSCELIGYYDKQLALTDTKTGVTQKFYADDHYYILKAYDYLDLVREHLEAIAYQETVQQLAGNVPTFDIQYGLHIATGLFDYSMLNSFTFATFTTPDAGSLFLHYSIPPMYKAGGRSVSAALDIISAERGISIALKHTMYSKLTVRGLFCSKISYVDGVLDIRIRSLVSFDPYGTELIDLPLQLVYYVDGIDSNAKNKYYDVRIGFTYTELKIPFSLLGCLDTSLDIGDFLSDSLLSCEPAINSYVSRENQPL